MINKIRKKIIWHYTLIIAAILILVFVTTFAVYRHTSIKNIKEGLLNYLKEEVWEAQKEVDISMDVAIFHQSQTDIDTSRYFTYWYLDDKLVRAETLQDINLSNKLGEKIISKTYKEERIYHENIKYNKVKWYFLIAVHNFELSDGHTVKVFTIANYTPMRQNLRRYLRFGVVLLFVLLMLSYIISSIFVSKPMRYIENIYQKQKRFVSDAAHELRTPLSVLYSYAELLEYKKDKNAIVADIKEEIEQMTNLIDRLLTLARYDNFTSKKNIEELNLNELLKSLVLSMSGLVNPNIFNLSLPSTNILIEADKVMLRQLFSILLDNAIKYTGDNKKIDIDVKIMRYKVSVSVSDNGIGIDEKNIPYIFDRFWRAEESRHQKGLGLGLSLADVIIKMHNGEIKVQSKSRQGTTFEVILPLKYK